MPTIIIIINSNDDDKNIDTIISELIDQLPDSILDTINDDIYTYVEKKDFQSLVIFLRNKKVEYKRSNIKMYHDHGNQFILVVQAVSSKCWMQPVLIVCMQILISVLISKY